MLRLITEVIALGLGMIISPGLFAIAVILLGSKIKPLSKIFSFLLGNVLTLIFLFCVGFFIGTSAHGNWGGAVRFFDIFFGFLLFVFAYKIYYYERDEKTPGKKKNTSRLLFCFGMGFVLSITNFDAETLYLISMNEIFESGVAAVTKGFLVLYSSLMILLPILLPIIVYLIFPKSSKKVLDILNIFLRKYGRIMMVVLFTLLGLWFLIKGFGIL